MPDYVESMFSVREVPWHRKGTIVQEALTAAQAITAAGLDWEVTTEPLFVQGNGDGFREVPWVATVRQDTGGVLGIVSQRYCPVQNRELFTFFDRVVDPEEGAFYETGGSLLGGRRVWLLAKVPGDFYVPGVEDDLVQNYVLLASSHDGSLCVLAKHTPVRVVCWNTLSMALHGYTHRQVSIKHTTNAVAQLREAHKVLGLATKRSRELQKAVTALTSVKMTTKLLQHSLKTIFPSTVEVDGEPPSAKAIRHRDTVMELYEVGAANILKGMRGTGWAFYNAVAEYADHAYPARQGTDKLNRIWFGQAERLKTKAASVLLEVAK